MRARANAFPIYLPVFADSSPKAYAAVAYVSNDHQSSVVMAESRATAGASSSISWCKTSQPRVLRP